jgi:toxin-antitoxin system PIN domain toxin
MKLPDVNVLVYAADNTSPWHAASVDALHAAGRSPRGLGLAWLALVGFVRITTRPGPHAHTLPASSALRLVRAWLDAPGAVVLQPGPRHFDLVESLLLKAGTAGNLTNDAHLAALAIEHGATLLSNDRDFARFEGLSFQHLA